LIVGTGAGARASSKSLTGKRLGRYSLVEHLTSGGMAEIFLARQENDGGLGKAVVLKVLQERFAEHREVVEMFLEEARIGAALRHPSIVDVYELAEDDGLRFIAMEYIEGKTLTELVLRALEVSRPLPLPYAAHIIGQVAEGLAYLQEGAGGIVHRDISPTNLVISAVGQTKIIDFGIAWRVQEEREDSGARPGKVSYMSPEQAQGHPLDGRSDIFSLGTILYEITVGRRLWRGPAEVVMRRLVEETPPPPTYLRRDFPPALELVILRALEKRPEDRYQSPVEMVEDLEAFIAAGGERVNNRLVARFQREIFGPGAQVSEKGARRARVFQDDDGHLDEDPSEELDFDRPRAAPAGAALARALRESGPLLPAAEAAESGSFAQEQEVPGAAPRRATPAVVAASAAASPVPASGLPRPVMGFIVAVLLLVLAALALLGGL
jgi:serine/threonine protein kinase